MKSIFSTLRVLAIFLALVLTITTAPSAFALSNAEYTAEALEMAQKEDKIVVIDFHASWCPTCRGQAKAFESLTADKDLKDVTVLKANFDKAVKLKRKYQVNKQSTLVLIKNGKVVGKTMGISSPSAIKKFILNS